MRRLSVVAVSAVAAVLSTAPSLAAQNALPPTRDSLRLGELQTAALRVDPRQRQLSLQAQATALRLANIDAERLPVLAINGQAQYQSQVTKISVPIPSVSIPTPPHDTYDAHVGAQESIFDPTLAPRRTELRAQLAEAQAQTRTTLFGLRQEVDEAFFSAALIEARSAALDAAIGDLSARLRETAYRLDQGTALPADTAAIAATLLQREQDRLQLHADRATAVARLSDLVGRRIDPDEPLAVGDYAAETARIAASLDTIRARPEYAQFAATRSQLEAQDAVESSQTKPKVSAFGRVGYGRPGLDMLSRDFQTYWLTGVQVQWTPWNWGVTDRDRQASQIQEQVVATNEAAFTRELQRNVRQFLGTAAQLDSALALDGRIIALRETIDRETRAKLGEGVVTAAEYVDKSTDLLSARLTRIQHSIALARARETFLSTLGVEVP
ncbi:MAG TPA: TolC family protein [Gemmatimonadaceae bacterium]|jgi:outer membrane protein TolC